MQRASPHSVPMPTMMRHHGLCRSAHPRARPIATSRPYSKHGRAIVVVVASTSAPQSREDIKAASQAGGTEQPGLPLHTVLVNYKRKTQLDGGTLLIQPLKVQMLQQCADMLTAAFVDTDAGKMQAYRRFLRRQVSEYLEQHIVMIPRTLILAATWVPDGDEDEDRQPDEGRLEASSSSRDHAPGRSEDSDPGASPGNGGAMAYVEQESSSSSSGSSSSDNGTPPQLIGTAEISLDASTRSRFWTLNSPDSAGYLCNMTVAAEHRRKGVAKQLLDAVEELCVLSGQPEVYLHARLQDQPAVALYRKAGFYAVKEDAWFVQWLGLDRRYLMRKAVNMEA